MNIAFSFIQVAVEDVIPLFFRHVVYKSHCLLGVRVVYVGLYKFFVGLEFVFEDNLDFVNKPANYILKFAVLQQVDRPPVLVLG